MPHFGNYAWSSWDKGETWQRDTNVHFRDQYGNYWYVQEGEDAYDKNLWRRDTLAGYHMTGLEYDALQRQKNAEQRAIEDSERAKAQWEQSFAFQREQAAMAEKARQQQLALLEEERTATADSLSAQQRKDAIYQQRALRFATGRRRGKAATIKVGSLGLSDEDLKLGKARLLGG